MSDLIFEPGSELFRRAILSPAMKWKVQNLRSGIEKGLVEPLRLG